MYILQRRLLYGFVSKILFGAMLGALGAWLLAGGYPAGFTVLPLAGGALWGAACGLLLFLHVRTLRTVLVRAWGPGAAWLVDIIVLPPLMGAGALVVLARIFPDLPWVTRPWHSAEVIFSALCGLLAFTVLDGLSLMSPRIRREQNPISEKRPRQGTGFLFAASLHAPPDSGIPSDDEQELRLQQLAARMFRRHGAGALGFRIRTSGADLVLFLPGRTNRTKNALFPFLERCRKDLSRHAGRLRGEFGFVPRLDAVLHYGPLTWSRPSRTGSECLGTSADLTLTLQAERQARTRDCTIWATDTALNKIMLPRHLVISGSSGIKGATGYGATRMFFIACKDAHPHTPS